MHPFSTLAAERIILQNKADDVLEKIKTCATQTPETIQEKLAALGGLKSAIYQDLNQIPHRALLLEAVDYLNQKYKDPITWSWHPEHTGKAKEPDLLGKQNGKVIISAEATTPKVTKGAPSKKMPKVLEHLSRMEGEKFYFVRSTQMKSLAETKISKMENVKIKVVFL
jgi:hypothetical protein